MKALFITSIGDPEKKTLGTIEMKEVPIPEPGPEEVRIKIAYASICGSDPHTLRGELGPMRPRILSRLPIRTGHEISGVIDAVGEVAAANGFKVGDRVTANYSKPCGTCYWCHTGREGLCKQAKASADGMAEYVSWHMSQVYKIPENVTLRQACMTEPMTIALNAVQTAQVSFGKKVAIFGGGGIGLMALQLARHAGASKIVVFELAESRQKMALELGADAVLNPNDPDVSETIRQLTNGLGFDCIIDSSGASSAAQSTLDMLAPDGNVVFFAMYKPEFDLKVNLFSQMYLQQKHIHGMYTSSDCFPKTIEMLPLVNLDAIAEKEYPLDEYKAAFDDAVSGKYAKVIFRVAGE
ncbi:zinc-binding dehydrogenase [uncultured Agathobaculum sp.]|uniref:zinc-dependent alcohol dehydrogenase n=1 Tax=uncultured Agathobaculum sp. TaxID=2048140 RepID=UPI002618CB7D|nr:zinc-binding dehydrogenase [uncultured Agathobaculum sp.]